MSGDSDFSPFTGIVSIDSYSKNSDNEGDAISKSSTSTPDEHSSESFYQLNESDSETPPVRARSVSRTRLMSGESGSESDTSEPPDIEDTNSNSYRKQWEANKNNPSFFIATVSVIILGIVLFFTFDRRLMQIIVADLDFYFSLENFVDFFSLCGVQKFLRFVVKLLLCGLFFLCIGGGIYCWRDSQHRSEILDEFLADCLKQKLKQRANFDNSYTCSVMYLEEELFDDITQYVLNPGLCNGGAAELACDGHNATCELSNCVAHVFRHNYRWNLEFNALSKQDTHWLWDYWHPIKSIEQQMRNRNGLLQKFSQLSLQKQQYDKIIGSLEEKVLSLDRRIKPSSVYGEPDDSWTYCVVPTPVPMYASTGCVRSQTSQ